MSDTDSETYYARLPKDVANTVELYRETHDLTKSEAVRELVADAAAGPFERICRIAAGAASFFTVAFVVWGAVLLSLYPLGLAPAGTSATLSSLATSGAIAGAITGTTAAAVYFTGLAAKIDAVLVAPR